MLSEANAAEEQAYRGKVRPSEEIEVTCGMCNELDALHLTLKRQFSGDLNEVRAAMLHQVRISNNDPQILAKWATNMLNNITLFNVRVKDGLQIQWHRKAGIGPAYTRRACDSKESSPYRENAESSKRAATLVHLSPRKKSYMLESNLADQSLAQYATEVREFPEEPVISLASEESFSPISPTTTFSLGKGDADLGDSSESGR